MLYVVIYIYIVYFYHVMLCVIDVIGQKRWVVWAHNPHFLHNPHFWYPG